MKKFRVYIILLIISVTLVAAFYNGLVVRRYRIKITGQVEGNARLVVLSDLHNTLYGDGQERLTEKVRKQKPDLILLTGDMIDNINRTDATEELLLKIIQIAPVYYVTGNHEFWTNQAEKIIALIESCGVKVLRNEEADIEINGIHITLCGTDDPDVLRYSDEEKYKEMQSPDELLNVFSGLNESSFNILMAHRPERIEEYKKYPFDLVLSGHAHGGQVRIPLIINGLFAPDQGWFPEYAGGKYVHRDIIHIVNRGLAKNSRVPRIFNPPEIVLIKLIGQN